LFAVGIGYADITKKSGAFCPVYFYKNTRLSKLPDLIIITGIHSTLSDKYNQLNLQNHLFCTIQPLFFIFQKIPHCGYWL